jgi:hypothetical protein
VSVLVSTVLLEVILHFTPLSLSITHSLEPQGYVRYDDELGLDLTPSFPVKKHSFYDASYDVWTNTYGCFDSEVTASDKPFVLLVGDSFTWGYTPFESKWGTQLEQLIGKRVLKCGVSGYGTYQEQIKAGRVLAQLKKENISKPRILLVGHFGWNDVEDDSLFPNSVVSHGYRMKNFGPESKDAAERDRAFKIAERYCIGRNEMNKTIVQAVKCYLSRNSVLYVLLKDNAKKVVQTVLPDSMLNSLGLVLKESAISSTTQETQNERGEFDVHADRIVGMKKFAQSQGMRLIFVLIPSREESRDFTDEAFRATNNEKSKRVMEENGIEYIDLTAAFRAAETGSRKPLYYWSGDTHWNPKGNTLAASLIAKAFVEKGIVPALATSSAAMIK